MVSVTVKSRSRSIRPFKDEHFPADEPLSTLAAAVASKSGLSVHRLRITSLPEGSRKHVGVSLEKTFAQNNLKTQDGSIELYAKDLGPQISWRTVFILEYLGPLLIHPYFYFYYGSFKDHSVTQTVSFALIMLHFIKREYETVFVHKFSLLTMPILNLFKNSLHYWILSGFNLAYFIYLPNALPGAKLTSWLPSFLFHTSNHSESTLSIIVGLWLYAEVSNFITHLNLSSLRSSGSKERQIPMGYGFSLVSFPNYFFESLSWLLFAILNNNPLSYLFLVVGSVQMLIWAQKKHVRYLKEFGSRYPKNRKVFVPFIY